MCTLLSSAWTGFGALRMHALEPTLTSHHPQHLCSTLLAADIPNASLQTGPLTPIFKIVAAVRFWSFPRDRRLMTVSHGCPAYRALVTSS